MSLAPDKDEIITALEHHTARLEAELAQAHTLILAALVFMPEWPQAWSRDQWRKDAERWAAEH